MALNPECVYNNIVNSVGNFTGGSYDYYTDMYTTLSVNHYLQLGTVKTISMSDLSSANDSLANALIKEVISFTNGAKLCIAAWCDHVVGGSPHGSYDVYAVSVAGVIKHNNTIYSSWPMLRTIQGYQGPYPETGTTFANPLTMVQQHGIKVILFTNFTYGQGNTILDETKAVYSEIQCFIPCQSSENPSGYQSFAGITTGTLKFFRLKDVSEADWLNNPQYVYFNYKDNLVTGNGSIFVCDDLPDFKSRLNALSPLTGDPYTISKQTPPPPSQEDDPSGPGGGEGDPDPSSDPIDFPDLPIGGALSSGAIKAFKVDSTTMTQVFNKLWNSSIFDISTYQKLTDNPLDALIALQCIPIVPTVGNTQYIKLGNFDTQASAPVITQEFYTIDAGSLKVSEYWGSALDYNPYTKVSIFVPFSGIHDLDVDDVMGKTIHLKYNYSILDGNMTAQLMCGNSVLYKWPCNVKETIPVTSRVMDALQPFLHGGAGMLAAGMMGSGAGLAAATIGAAVNVAMSKTHTSRSGDISGSTGLLDDFEPYLIIHRPIQSLAQTFKNDKGYPSNISATLNGLHGYTEVEYVHLTGISGATDTELQEIEDLLKSGVII